jgi:hypothetical protein
MTTSMATCSVEKAHKQLTNIQAAAEKKIRSLRAMMTSNEALSWIDAAMPHLPASVRKPMSGPDSLLFTKYFAARCIGIDRKVQPDFNLLQLLCLCSWSVGPVASIKQLCDTMFPHFPYWVGFTPEEVGGSVLKPEWIEQKIRKLLRLNLNCHGRLFEPVGGTSWRMKDGYESQIFDTFGFPDTIHPVSLNNHYSRLPPEIVLQIFDEYLHLKGKVLYLKEHCRNKDCEPLLAYDHVFPSDDEHGISEAFIQFASLSQILAPSLVCREWHTAMTEALFKKSTFDLTAGNRWLQGVHSSRLAMITKVHLTLNLDLPVNTRDRNMVLIKMIETGCTLGKLTLKIQCSMSSAHRRQSIKQNFRNKPEIQLLSQVRGIKSIAVEFQYLGCNFMPADADGKPLMDDELRWLEQQMALPKTPIAFSAPREEVPTGLQSTKDLRRDAAPSGGQELSQEEQSLGHLQNIDELPQQKTPTDVQAVLEKEQPLRRSRRIKKLHQNKASTGVQEGSEEKLPTRCSKRIKELREKSEDVSKPKSTPKRKNASGGGGVGGVRKRAKKG